MNRPLTLEDLAALAHQHRAYSLVSCRQGGYSFRVPGAGLVHSTVNPAGEAMRQAREAGVVPGSRPLLLGCGLGWQALACLELGASSVRILEADVRVLATLHALPSARRLLQDSRVQLHRPADDGEFLRLLAGLFKSEHENQPLLTLATTPALWAEHLPGSCSLVLDILSRRRNGYAQEPSLAHNARLNSVFLATSAEFRLYEGSWKQQPVVVCGAGPSLDKDLETLRAQRAELRIIAVNAALNPLLKAGIVPDLVIAVDGMNVIQADLPVVAENIPLLWVPGTNHGFVSGWPGPRILALPVGPGLPPTPWHGRTPGTLQSGMGTVAGPALDAARQLSQGQLYLSGVDLGWSSGRGYAGNVRREMVSGIRSDFDYMRRQLGLFVNELRLAGRHVSAFGEPCDWMEHPVRHLETHALHEENV